MYKNNRNKEVYTYHNNETRIIILLVYIYAPGNVFCQYLAKYGQNQITSVLQLTALGNQSSIITLY